MEPAVSRQFRVRQVGLWAAAAGAGLAVFGYQTLARGFAGADYVLEARPAVDALVSGHISVFLERAPAYGGSLVLRAPFVLVAHALGASELGMYRASVIPALLACGILAIWLASRLARANAHWVAGLVAIGVCVFNPMARNAILEGHPEELLGGVLCVAAVVCAVYDRPVWAGVLLGLAIANKEWALLAVGPVLVALPGRRLLALGWALAAAAAILLPFVIGGAAVSGQGIGAVNTANIFHPWQVWWFLGSPQSGYRAVPGWLPGAAHPLIILIAIPLTLLYLERLRRRPAAAADGLLLLAFLLLLRCALDPWDEPYYATPFLIALVAWEVLRFERVPALAVAASVVAWIVYIKLPQHLSLDGQAVSFLVASLGAAGAMAWSLYAPGARKWQFRRASSPTNLESPLESG